MIDLVYIYSNEHAIWNELRYSLRSVQQNLSGYGRIWIIGNPPPWVDNCNVIRCPTEKEETVHRKYFDVNVKIHTAANYPEISERFFLMWDDIYFINKVDVSDLIGPWHVGGINIAANLALPGFNERLASTLSLFGDGALNYESHMPKLFRKQLLQDVYVKFDPILRRLVVPSLYYNHYRDIYEPKTCEHLITRFFGEDNAQSRTSDDIMWIEQNVEGKVVMNHNNYGLTKVLMKYLHSKFPNKSKFEFDDFNPSFEKDETWRSCCS